MRRWAVRKAVVLGLATLVPGAWAAVEEPWSGVYRLEWVKGSAASVRSDGAAVQVVVAKAPDADAAKLMERWRADLSRWTFSDAVAAGEGQLLRRFVSREYAEFGWAALHEAGDMECLDGAHLFVCRTKPGATVAFGPEGPRRESMTAQTGVFGIALHQGAFELKKLD